MITSNVTTCIHQAFIEQAILHPNKVAITLDDQSLTYNQLLNQVRQLTFVLINDKGVHPGDIVCQYIDRSIEMIIGIMSIMMSGAVYAPLNPSNPLDRLELLVHQVDTKLILVNQMSLSCISSLNVPILDISEVIESYHLLTDAQIEELSKVDVTPDSISHIVFTSGSTGIPKAVQIRHRNFMGYMHAHFIQTNDVILQLASSSFDVHLDEINGALVRGGHLVLLKAGGHLDFDYVTKVIHEKNVTFVAPVPSWMNALGKFLSENRSAQERIKQVRLWYLGGEQLFSSTVHQFLPFVSEQCHILNSYGPAEITEAATFYEVRREELSTITSLPIGRPMTGYRIYLLDEYRQPVIPGQLGEIIVGGVGVFAGYYGRADLTSQVLIDINGEQCYATGDLARLDFGSGELMFIGRRDFQVKVRGQRIELSAIELVIIQSSPSVINCVVVKENFEDDNYLTAYVQVKENHEKSKLQKEMSLACQSRLPSYMIPSKWLFAPELPLNPNGKIDRNALGTIALQAVDFPNEQQTTRILSSLERKLQDIFVRAFRLKSLPDIENTFGQLGGTSLGAMHALNLIRQEVFEKMDIGLLFANPSVRELAVVLESALSNVEPDQEKQEDDVDFSIRPRGTQWLVLVLRRFGTRIGDDVIIDDMKTVYDVHLITIGNHSRLSSTSEIQCHTFEQRRLKLRPVTIGPSCIFKPMSIVLPGVTFIGHNRLAPCSLALPHDRFAAHTDWSGSPTKRVTVHHGCEPPQLLFAERQSSLGMYNVTVGRFNDDILVLYFGENGWLGWQSGIDLRHPFRPCDIYIKLFFIPFICKPKAKHVLIIGLGGGILPMLIRHYFPSVLIHVVEIDKTVIELASEFFDLTEMMANSYLHVIEDDGFRYVSETVHRYDIVFIDAFDEEAMPAHMNTAQFFLNISGILNSDGCLATNANLSNTDAFDRLAQTCCSTFESNVLFAHTNIIENAHVIISGTLPCLKPITSQAQAIHEAQELESDAMLEFSLSRLIALAYRGLLIDKDTRT
ncbi:unnamed protein product [Rotaria sordida]|uniref:Carrier domain-containing protein n=1 Tax=Rotaria sordida TaxID=392033 RepID=A0A814H0V3_9BILA|nr:unnamed protein product [Rotaria sordida]CAF1102069.1 unnamed protein product [Rotaria sordida]